jgi:hypothetical protein
MAAQQSFDAPALIDLLVDFLERKPRGPHASALK